MKVKAEGARTFPIPSDKELDDVYLKAFCRNFGLDVDKVRGEPEQFAPGPDRLERHHLRGTRASL